VARQVLVAVIALCASIARADLLQQVLDRAREITGPSFQSCGVYTDDSAEDCFLAAYRAKQPAIAYFSVAGVHHQAADARVITPENAFVTVSAYSEQPGLKEKRCAHPFIAIEFTKERLRCKDDYRAPLGAKILKSKPVWLTGKDEHPTPIERPAVPPSVCPDKKGKIIAQVLVDALGTVPEVQLIVVPKGCSAAKIEKVLKRWRYTPPKKDGKLIPATVEVLEISFK
jgi:hypothetical protein